MSPALLSEEESVLKSSMLKKHNRFLRGRQIAEMIYGHFQPTGAYDTAQGLSELFSICLQKDDVQDFDTRWDQILPGTSEMPPRNVLFDKPEGLSAVTDEYFEKFDKPDKNHVSHEHVCGKWASEKGESCNFRDCNTNRLSVEELVDDSGYLHGWLDRNSDGWQARLAFYDI